MVDDQRRCALLVVRECAQRNLAAGGRGQIDMVQGGGVLLKLGIDLEYHVVLIQLSKDYRYLTLAESIIQRVVDHLRGDAEPRRSIAIDHELGLRAPVLLIIRDILKRWES